LDEAALHEIAGRDVKSRQPVRYAVVFSDQLDVRIVGGVDVKAETFLALVIGQSDAG
jgi:hypothetical protein